MVLVRWLFLLATVLPNAAAAADRLAGPYPGSVERVVDGDTIVARVTVWLDQDIRVLVRIRGVDAPELQGACASERARAGEAADELRRLVGSGEVVLTAIQGDKYFGRVVADVRTAGGADLAGQLLAGGFARPYGGRARASWCAAAAAGAS